MSDPVTNVEIEDVLASIRRLVSEEARPEAHEIAAPSKLVLTPALRVEVPEETQQEPEVDVEDDLTTDTLPKDDFEFRPAGLSVVDPTPAEPDEPVVANAANPVFVSEKNRVADVAPEASVNEPPVVAAPVAEAPMVDVPSEEAAFADVPAEEPSVDEVAEAIQTPLEKRIADLEAAVGDQADQWEPDGEDEADAYSGSAVDSLAWVDHVPIEDRLEETRSSLAQEEDLSEPEYEPEIEIPAAIVEQEEEPVVDPGFEAEAMSAVDEEELVDDVAQTLGVFGAEDESFLDEEALRELITEIVRQELQGTLGERITRNVRKLVRREIQRAMTVQDLQ
ncbi:MAG: hypothetical protein JXR13_02005 [Thalassovita sp.]